MATLAWEKLVLVFQVAFPGFCISLFAHILGSAEENELLFKAGRKETKEPYENYIRAYHERVNTCNITTDRRQVAKQRETDLGMEQAKTNVWFFKTHLRKYGEIR